MSYSIVERTAAVTMGKLFIPVTYREMLGILLNDEVNIRVCMETDGTRLLMVSKTPFTSEKAVEN